MVTKIGGHMSAQIIPFPREQECLGTRWWRAKLQEEGRDPDFVEKWAKRMGPRVRDWPEDREQMLDYLATRGGR